MDKPKRWLKKWYCVVILIIIVIVVAGYYYNDTSCVKVKVEKIELAEPAEVAPVQAVVPENDSVN